MTEILPCPFCGGPARMWHQTRNRRGYTLIQCDESLCNTIKHGIGNTKERREQDAMLQWNTRAATAAPQQPTQPLEQRARHVEVLSAIRSTFADIPLPCEERDALDAAIAALTQPQAVHIDAEEVECAICNRIQREHRPGYSASNCAFVPNNPAQPQAGVVVDKAMAVRFITAFNCEMEYSSRVRIYVNDADNVVRALQAALAGGEHV